MYIERYKRRRTSRFLPRKSFRITCSSCTRLAINKREKNTETTRLRIRTNSNPLHTLNYDNDVQLRTKTNSISCSFGSSKKENETLGSHAPYPRDPHPRKASTRRRTPSNRHSPAMPRRSSDPRRQRPARISRRARQQQQQEKEEEEEQQA